MPLDMPFMKLKECRVPAWVETKIMHGQKVDLLEFAEDTIDR